jgi:hypothetical protein
VVQLKAALHLSQGHDEGANGEDFA